MKIFFLFLLLCQAALAEHRGGNGGDPSEIALKKRLQDIAKFIEKETTVFGAASQYPWSEIMKEVSLQVTTKELKDKFGSKRCALNFEAKKLIVINERCLLEKQFSGRIINALLAHELLNLKKLESPTNGRSRYSISDKFLNIPDVLISGKPAPYIVKVCSVRLTRELNFSKVALGIIDLKGYKVSEANDATFFIETDSSFTQSTHLNSAKGAFFWQRTFESVEENLLELPSCLEL